MSGKLCKRRIVFVFSRLELGGAERQGLLLARHLKEQCGAEVQVAGLKGEPGALSHLCEKAGIPCHPLRLGQLQSQWECLLALQKFIFRMRRARPELLVSYTRNANVFSGLAWRLCGASGFVWNQADEGLNLEGELASRMAVSLTPCFISNSAGGASFLQERYGVPSSKLKIIRNGIALARPAKNRTEWRQRLGLSDDDFVACMVANISLFKDHDTLLAAWQKVLKLSVPTTPFLLLAGRCDRPKEDISRLVYDLKLGDTIRFLGAVDDVAGLLEACDLFVYSSRSEGLPNAVVEAMASGLPVVGSDIPGIREAVGEAGAGFLAQPGDPARLAQNIVKLMDDPLLRKRYSENLRNRAMSEFSLPRMLEDSARYFSLSMKGQNEGNCR